MPMDGITLGFMASELTQKLQGGRIDKVTQPERDEVILQIRSLGNNYSLLLSASANYSRVHVTHEKKYNPMEPPMFCMLLRKHLTGGRVSDVRQINGDRILEIDIDSMDEFGEITPRTLITEIMGRHSNIILTMNGKIIDAARHIDDSVSSVREVLPGLMYLRPPAQDKLQPNSMDATMLSEKLTECVGSLAKAISASISGVSMQAAREIAFRVTGDEDTKLVGVNTDMLAIQIIKVFHTIKDEFCPNVMYGEDGSPFDFAAFKYQSRAHLQTEVLPTLSDALDTFYKQRDLTERIGQKASSLLKILRNNIERCEKKLAMQLETINETINMDLYRIKGELLMGNIYAIPKGVKQVMLPNYYSENYDEIEIELDVRISPNANAQKYFKHYQKLKSAKLLVADQKAMTDAELAYLEGQLDNLKKCTNEAELNEIRDELTNEGYVRKLNNRKQLKKLPPSKPYHYVSSDGIDILVGKNNLQNDKLTSSAMSDELWLHAKDIPGSHVIVLSTNPPNQTITEAAILAAYYSKAKDSSSVPVDYTRKKYVKKPSGAKPGYVIYTNQHTAYVTPEEAMIKTLKMMI